MKCSGRARRILAGAAAATISASIASAAPSYWDINANSAGASGGTTAAGTWDTSTANWSADPSGASATTPWLNDGSATAVFAAGSNATGAYAVTLADGFSLQVNGLRFEEGTVTLTPGLGSSLTLVD